MTTSPQYARGLRRLATVLIMAVLAATFTIVAAPGAASAATVSTATTVNTVSPNQATIGEAVQYTLRVTLPAGRPYYHAAVLNTVSLGMTVVGSSTVSCVSGGLDCLSDLPGQSSGYTLPASGQRIGWSLGSIAESSQDRVVTIVFSARVDDVARNAIAGNPTNAAFVAWNDSPSASPPTNAAWSTYGSNGPTGSILIRVKEPALTVTLGISDSTPAPGSTFVSTVVVSNANATYTSSAFGVVVTAAIPEGVVVDTSTISTGGTLSGSTITWTLPNPIAKNAATTLTWSATLAPTLTLTGDPLVATARITHYQSLATGGRSYPSTPVSASATALPDFPALTVVKFPTTDETAYAGEPFGWTVQVTNSGRSIAGDVLVGDLLPPHWTFTSGSATLSIAGAPESALVTSVSAADPDTDRVTLTWGDVGALDVGQTAVIRYSAVPTSAAALGSGTPQENFAGALAEDATGATGNALGMFSAEATASTRIESADLGLTFGASEPIAGTASTSAWTVTVSNAGPDAASGPFLVTDTSHPATGLTVTSASGTGWSCGAPDPLTSSYTCTRADANETLPAGSAFPPITVAASIAADVPAGTLLSNTISVQARTADADLSDNEITVEGAVITAADLAVSTALTGTIAAGQQSTWTVDVTNLGPSVSRGPITVVSEFDAALTGVDVTGLDWVCTLGVGQATCVYSGDLPVTAAPRLTGTGMLDAGFVGDLTTTATVSATTSDAVTANDTSTSTVGADSQTTLLFEKNLDGTVLVPGGQAQYDFSVENIGTADARAVVVTDTLPDGLVFAGMVPSASWACVEFEPTPSAVWCELSGTLPAGDAQTVSILVDVPGSLTGDVVNVATAGAENAPAVSDSDDTALTSLADLGISRTHPAGAVIAGTSVDYTVIVSNYGPSAEPAGITVTDDIAAGLDPVSATGVGWTCDAPSGQTITCVSSDPLPAGTSLPSITVTVAIPAAAGPGEFTSLATVKGALDEPVPDGHSNSAADVTEVTGVAVLSIIRQIPGGTLSVVAGESIDYTIVVSNAGPSVAEAVVVAGFLPPGFVATAYTGPGWTCTLETLVCSRPELGVGTAIITVTVTTSADIPDGTVVLNTAELSWTDGRAQRGVDTADVRVTVNAIADLVLTKIAAAAAPAAGTDLSWTLSLQNTGSSDAVAPISIVDQLPPGIRFLGNGPGWSCTADDVDPSVPQPVTCALGDGTAGLAASGTAEELTFVTSSSGALGFQTSVNTAVVSSDTVDAAPADNLASASVVFGESADLTLGVTATGTGFIGGTGPATVIVRNSGPTNAAGVVVVSELPLGLEYVDSVGSDSGWTCSTTLDPSTARTTVSCALADPIPSGSDAPALSIRVSVTAGAYPSTTTLVSVSSTTSDPALGDNSASVILTVAPLVDFGIAVSRLSPLILGETTTYRVAVTNAGPTEDPGGFSVLVDLPPGLAYVGSAGTDVICSTVGSAVTCVFSGALPVGATRTVDILTRVLADAPAVIVTTVEVRSLFDQLATSPILASDSGAVTAAGAGLPGAGLPVTGIAGFVGVLAIALLLIAAGAAAHAPGRRRLPTLGRHAVAR